ncbi:MAG: Yip1 family protein [Candidatus Thorarchaeota archaeon]
MRRCEFCDSPVPADATVCPVCKETIAEETLERILPMLKRPESPEVRFMGIRERLWGVIRRPSATYRDIGQRPDYAGPFVLILFNALIMVGLFLSLSSKITTTVIVNATSLETAPANLLTTSDGGIFWISALASFMPTIMLGIVYLIIGTAFAHFAFKLTGGAGGKMKTLSIIGYSMTPVILVRAIGVLAVLVALPGYPDILSPAEVASLAPVIVDWAYTADIWLILDILTTGSFVWTGYLLIFGIREAHDTSTLWAAVVAVLCMVVLGWTFWQVH